MHRFCDTFSNDLSRNDKIARNYYNSYMGHQQRYISKENLRIAVFLIQMLYHERKIVIRENNM